MPKSRIISRQQLPGNVFGETFTASIPDRPVIPAAGEGYYDSLSLSYRGTIAAATTVLLETFLNLVNPLVFIANEPRVVMRGRDLFVLDTAWYDSNPAFNEGAIATTDTVLGIRVPLWIEPKGRENLSYNLTRVAVTNISAEVFSLAMNFNEKNPVAGRGRLDMREIPFTTPAATGPFQVTPRLPQIGKLLGLLAFGTTVPTSGATAATIQSLSLDIQNRRLWQGMWQDLTTVLEDNIDFTRADATALVKRQVLQNYGFIDLRDEPIDLLGQAVSVNVDSEVASDTGRIVPIIEIPQPAG